MFHAAAGSAIWPGRDAVGPLELGDAAGEYAPDFQ